MGNDFNVIKEKVAQSRLVLERDFSVKKIGIFGSVAKGFSRDGSDVDFLVEFGKPIGLFRFEGLRLFLEQCLKRKVDLATPRALKPFVREEIMNSVIYL